MRRPTYPVSLLLVTLLVHTASAQLQHEDEALAGRWPDLALTRNCEDGFNRFMHMAQTGQLGDDVTNANIGVFKNHARLELVRGEAPKIVLFLTPKQSAEKSDSQYFTIEAGPGARSEDIVRVARALDEAFLEDPFQPAYDFFNAPPSSDPIPSVREAWEASGWKGVMRVFSRHTVALASLTYTVIVIVGLATLSVANLWLLWKPHRSSVTSKRA